MKKLPLALAAALVAGAALSGCSAADSASPTDEHTDHATTSAPTEASAAASGPAAAASGSGASGTGASGSAAEAATHNAADALFAQMMIPHHEQAVEMSGILLAKSDIDAPVVELAERIKAAQSPEIARMASWLRAWGEPAEAGDGHGMAGMMREADLAALAEAEGPEAVALFLTQMVAHHDGAVEMARTEIEQGRDADAVALARDILAAQEAEITEMRELLVNP
ncbi:MAG: DUF305 domain-containing protein [Arthrobacter sp.]|uniref:DUF305 domain-containing protein n=1 Tax=Arthrobacter sp. TaxID=1667 RepID=UPI0034953652